LHAQPHFQKNENLAFPWLGVGAYESISFGQGGVHHNVPFSKNTFLEILQLLFLFFWKILYVVQFCLNCMKSLWFFKKAYLNAEFHLFLNVFASVCPNSI
tara:strand:+ start:202 stop:501 length:300 start_codon:yes stop_codon:yes gene_type:complete